MIATRTATRVVALTAFLYAAGFVGAAPAQAQHGHHHGGHGGHGGHGHYHGGHGHYGHSHGHYHGGHYGGPVVVVAPRPVYVAPPPRVHYHPEYHIDGLFWSPGRGVGLSGHYDAVPHYGW